MTNTEHTFGGSWTNVKLDAISYYLRIFTTALKNRPTPDRPFELWYVDAFAGTGERTERRRTGGILEGRPVELEKVQLNGSAKRALAIEPRFKHLVFIEQNGKRFAALRQLERDYPGRGIVVHRGDANQVLETLFSGSRWAAATPQHAPRRAVVFLDPYGMNVGWRTLRLLAETRAADVWYLFPLGAAVRQLAFARDAVDSAKQAALDEIFGTPDWRTELYDESVQPTLFPDVPAASAMRSASASQIEAYARRRLESLFPYVSTPLPLLTDRGARLFSLFCASGNASPAAQALVRKFVSDVLKKYG